MTLTVMSWPLRSVYRSTVWPSTVPHGALEMPGWPPPWLPPVIALADVATPSPATTVTAAAIASDRRPFRTCFMCRSPSIGDEISSDDNDRDDRRGPPDVVVRAVGVLALVDQPQPGEAGSAADDLAADQLRDCRVVDARPDPVERVVQGERGPVGAGHLPVDRRTGTGANDDRRPVGPDRVGRHPGRDGLVARRRVDAHDRVAAGVGVVEPQPVRVEAAERVRGRAGVVNVVQLAAVG